MVGEGLGHPASPFVVKQIDRYFKPPGIGPHIPRAHEGMLQNGQLIRIVAHVVEQPLYQGGRHGRTAHGHRPLDGAPTLFSGHARDQVLALVDGLGQILKLRALAKKVRAHGDDDINGHLRVVAGLEQ